MNGFVVVVKYVLQWRPDQKSGFVYLYGRDPELEKYVLQVDSLSDLSALGTVLREERPVYFHPENRIISTGPEPVGENE